MTLAVAGFTYRVMNLPPDDLPSLSSPVKPRISAAQRRMRQEDRLKTIRLRMAIRRELDQRGATTPTEIGKALSMSAVEATRLLTRRQWRAGDVALLEAAAAQLGVQAPG